MFQSEAGVESRCSCSTKIVKLTEAVNTLIRKVNVQNGTTKQILDYTADLKEIIIQKRSVSEATGHQNNLTFSTCTQHLPIKSEEDWQDIETYLENTTNMEQAVSLFYNFTAFFNARFFFQKVEVAKIGGSNGTDFVKF